MNFSHVPVMPEECMDGLNLKSGGIYFDGTIGGAGHSYEILKRTSPDGRLIATDLDDDAIAAATQRLSEFSGRFKIYKSDYKNFANVLKQEGVSRRIARLRGIELSARQRRERVLVFATQRAARYAYG